MYKESNKSHYVFKFRCTHYKWKYLEGSFGRFQCSRGGTSDHRLRTAPTWWIFPYMSQFYTVQLGAWLIFHRFRPHWGQRSLCWCNQRELTWGFANWYVHLIHVYGRRCFVVSEAGSTFWTATTYRNRFKPNLLASHAAQASSSWLSLSMQGQRR